MSAQPTLRPTSPAALVATGLLATCGGWLVGTTLYGELPPLSRWAALATALVGAALLRLAAQVRAQLVPRPGVAPARRLLHPLQLARAAVLAKACSVTGALVTGGYAGLALWLLPRRTSLPAAGPDLTAALACAVGGAVLLLGGLLLERACRAPRRPDNATDGPRA